MSDRLGTLNTRQDRAESRKKAGVGESWDASTVGMALSMPKEHDCSRICRS